MLQAYKQSWLYTFRWNRRMDCETYWKAIFIHILVGWVPATMGFFLEDSDYELAMFFCIVPFLISVFPVIGSTVQRLHDIGKSAWWLLLYWILAFIGIGMLLLIWTLKKDSVLYENKWGECSKTLKEEEQSDFVDERVSERDIQAERNQIVVVLIKIFVFYFILFAILFSLY